jgi:hypothetical protein
MALVIGRGATGLETCQTNPDARPGKGPSTEAKARLVDRAGETAASGSMTKIYGLGVCRALASRSRRDRRGVRERRLVDRRVERLERKLSFDVRAS